MALNFLFCSLDDQRVPDPGDFGCILLLLLTTHINQIAHFSLGKIKDA